VSLRFVSITLFMTQKRNGKLEYRRETEELTSTYDEFGMRCERDAFDALLDHAPDKLQVVKKVNP
jgi:parvin